mmetsp:Transcript_15906/g.49732  ORF Transcript_15906/g.49732 Transcript_15906/m.49732 type:complete len:152 (-) Transcript_15906:113-568(-)
MTDADRVAAAVRDLGRSGLLDELKGNIVARVLTDDDMSYVRGYVQSVDYRDVDVQAALDIASADSTPLAISSSKAEAIRTLRARVTGSTTLADCSAGVDSLLQPSQFVPVEVGGQVLMVPGGSDVLGRLTDGIVAHVQADVTDNETADGAS